MTLYNVLVEVDVQVEASDPESAARAAEAMVQTEGCCDPNAVAAVAVASMPKGH